MQCYNWLNWLVLQTSTSLHLFLWPRSWPQWQNLFKGSIYFSAVLSKSFMLWWRWLCLQVATCAGSVVSLWLNAEAIDHSIFSLEASCDVDVNNSVLYHSSRHYGLQYGKTTRPWSNQTHSGLENLCIKVNAGSWCWSRPRPVLEHSGWRRVISFSWRKVIP